MTKYLKNFFTRKAKESLKERQELSKCIEFYEHLENRQAEISPLILSKKLFLLADHTHN